MVHQYTVCQPTNIKSGARSGSPRFGLIGYQELLRGTTDQSYESFGEPQLLSALKKTNVTWGPGFRRTDSRFQGHQVSNSREDVSVCLVHKSYVNVIL